MSTKIRTVAGVFADRDDARRAVIALQAAGFTEHEIGVAGPDDDGLHVAQKSAEHVGETYAGEGALAGVTAGVGIGALWGLGILAGAIPAIGPAIAGGTLAALLSSAAVGAAAAGVGGALIGMGIPKEEAEYYEGEILAGNTVVTVSAGERFVEAKSILTQHDGHDMAARVADTMQTTDRGEAPIAPSPTDTTSPRRAPHLDFTSKLPISPADAQEELTGLASHAATAPASTRPIAPEHVSFEMPVVDEPRPKVDEEANMPPTEVDIPVEDPSQDWERMPPKRF